MKRKIRANNQLMNKKHSEINKKGSDLNMCLLYRPIAKGDFFSESAMCVLDLQISKKNIPKNCPELEI